MRVKKAVKQLNKAGDLIGAVTSRYTDADSHLKELLKSASAAVAQAKGALTKAPSQPNAASKNAAPKDVAPKAAAPKNPSQAFTGSKTDFVRSVIESSGASGATPRDIDEAFKARRIERSKNLIYNSLGALVKQKRIAKKGDRYVVASAASKSATPATKKRISPEGLKRIIEANKKRWAAKKAADARKTAPKKAAAR